MKTKKIRKVILFMIAIMLFSTSAVMASESAAAKQKFSAETIKILELVNSQRTNRGIPKLKIDEKLNRLAQMKAEDMAANKYFSHNSPTYGSAFDMMQEYNYSYRTAGENIAKGQKTPQSVMRAWMGSSGHRANILKSSYSKLGVGYALSKSGTPYWVQIFAG